MRVFVIGIDGLEAKLVKKWNLRGLMQEDWGTHRLDPLISSEEKVYTPIIWGAFLLGRGITHESFTYKDLQRRRIKAGYGVLYPLYILRTKIFGSKNLGLRKYLMKLGLFSLERIKERIADIERLPVELVEETMVQEAEKLGYKVWIREFPSYNDEVIARFRAYMDIYFSEALQTRLKQLEEVYSYTLDIFNEALEACESHDLILYYTPLIDYANHMLYRPKRLKPIFHLATYYRRMEKIVLKVSSRLKDAVILVISDHGYDPYEHEHSRYGFWSSNTMLEEKPKLITDFKSIILDFLSDNSTVNYSPLKNPSNQAY